MATQTQVLIAHTGQRLQVDITQFASLEEFKAWVARQSSIPPQNIIALTPQGKTVKIQTIQTEKEIYIYDIRITQSSTPGTPTSLVSEEPLPKDYTAPSPPDFIEDTHSLQSWQELFKSRRNWALKMVEDTGAMAEAAQERHSEMDVMIKCLDAAVANLDTAVRPLEPKYNELKKWVTPTQEDYDVLAANWERYLELARSITISPAMVRFMTGRELRKSRQASLEDLIDLETARKAGKLANTSLRKFSAKASELDKTTDKMFNGCDDLFQEFDKVMNRSALQRRNQSAELQEDIEAVAKKIDTDYQTTLGYSTSTRDVLQASKTAANHTERLLPSIRNRALEMKDMLHYATQARNDLASDSLVFMRTIAEITSFLSNIKTQMIVLNQGEEEMTTFDYLRLIQQLPFMYASFVAEAIRRREWGDKVKTDSSTLVNEMALFQDEELKRRRKWQKMVGSTYGPEKTENNVLGLEVNLLGEEEPWPSMTKKDLDDFLVVVQRQKAESTVVGDITKLIQELNNPTKQQSKRVKAFKNGSVHEAALGRSGLMIRGDDDLMRSLQDDKTRLESKLKTAESRVRRLESLLHRQSTESRPSLGNLFQPGGHERNNSTASIKSPGASEDRRRSSASENNDALVHRITQLEGDLHAEKERNAVFGKEAAARTRDMEGRMDEANSTKKDLLENMEALKREFLDERKSLETEIKTLKVRLEETEDEIEHFGESRENEKVTNDEKLSSLEDEVKRMTQEKKDEASKTQGQVNFLRNEANIQRERNETLEMQLQEARESIKYLTRTAETSEASTETQIRTLKELHSQMSPNEGVPDDINDLTEAVANKSGDILAKVEALEEDMVLLKSDLEVAQTTVKEGKAELSKTQNELSSEETTRMKIYEAYEEVKAKCSTLEDEVIDGREQLDQLRTKMTEGESGSESLRVKLQEEEKRVAELSESLATRQSQRLGFSVNRQDSKTVIQKVPRAERTSRDPNDSSDPSSSVRRSVSLTAATLADSTDLKLLYWMNADDAETELSQYQSFLSGPGSFDIDAFAEAIYRRVKELEHTARKYTRDARTYRERAHQAVKDSHDKIAFRHFKEGDLALFLPTRNQTTGAWAAFNVGCPHFFLREQENHRLRQREWLVARITKIQERVVDLSKSLSSTSAQLPPSETDSINTGDEFDNPFDLSDGLRWWLIDAHEDKAGAPATPGLGKSTVAANNVEAMADIHTHQVRTGASKLLPGGKNTGIEGVSRTLSKSLESRRSSSGSTKRTLPFAGAAGVTAAKSSALASETNSLRAAPADSPDMGGSMVASGSGSKIRGNEAPSAAAKRSEDNGNADEDRRHMPPPPLASPSSPSKSVSPAKSMKSGSGSPQKQRQRLQEVEQDAASGHGQTQAQLQRGTSDASVESRDKSVVWDSLWSLDVSYPGK
ncbi:autophagy-related protein 11-domain-containing protein [Xylariales sp. AK1849]|nr:autophagy-related protein 11-domain-containing protein [Xylariales sp. AK1849]